MKWVRYNQDYPQRYAFKRDVPKAWQHWAVKVRFLWETVWIVRDESGKVYMPDGGWVTTLDFFLKTPGHVIGFRDMTTADAHDWAVEWRTAMADKIQDQIEAARKAG